MHPKIKCSISDSNWWPPACKAGALPTELIPQCFYSSVQMSITLIVPVTTNNKAVNHNIVWCFANQLLSLILNFWVIITISNSIKIILHIIIMYSPFIISCKHVKEVEPSSLECKSSILSDVLHVYSATGY